METDKARKSEKMMTKVFACDVTVLMTVIIWNGISFEAFEV